MPNTGEKSATTRLFNLAIFDAKVDHLLRDEYRIQQVTKVHANSIEELCARMDGVDTTQR